MEAPHHPGYTISCRLVTHDARQSHLHDNPLPYYKINMLCIVTRPPHRLPYTGLDIRTTRQIPHAAQLTAQHASALSAPAEVAGRASHLPLPDGAPHNGSLQVCWRLMAFTWLLRAAHHSYRGQTTGSPSRERRPVMQKTSLPPARAHRLQVTVLTLTAQRCRSLVSCWLRLTLLFSCSALRWQRPEALHALQPRSPEALFRTVIYFLDVGCHRTGAGHLYTALPPSLLRPHAKLDSASLTTHCWSAVHSLMIRGPQLGQWAVLSEPDLIVY